MNDDSLDPSEPEAAAFWSFDPKSQAHTCLAEFAGTRDSLHAIRDMVESCLDQTALPDMAAAGFVMAVDELAANVIEHGYERSPLLQEAAQHLENPHAARRILIEMRGFSNRVECIITDFAAIHFAVDQATPQGLNTFFEEQRMRGLGLDIIRFCVDEVAHQWLQPCGNQTRLVKFFDAPPPL